MTSKLETGYLLNDQVKFSTLSGDFNPVHTEFKYAKRSMWGGVVVHGIHQVLSVIELFISRKNIRFFLSKIHVEFLIPLIVDTRTHVVFKEDQKNVVASIVSTDGVTYTDINFLYEEAPSNYKFVKNVKNGVYKNSLPKELSIDQVSISENSINLVLNYKLLQELFPNIVNNFPYSQIAIILSSTQIVGMHCPGKDSIFSKLDMYFEGCKNINLKKIDYKVKKIHSFFKLVDTVGYGDGFKYTIRSFFRPKSQRQMHIKGLSDLVKSNQFLGSKVLVVGGSRGIGEVASKLLAIGGAEVTITYFTGDEDAKKIVNNLKKYGYVANCMQFNVLDNVEIEEKFTHLYYFASPKIFTGNKDIFSEKLFESFSSHYLVKFAQIVQCLYSNGLKRVFYPSSTAIDELINGMWEYSSVKIAGEHLCDLLENRYKDLKIYKPRFPRIATDQTLTVMPVESIPPESVLVKFITEFHNL